MASTIRFPIPLFNDDGRFVGRIVREADGTLVLEKPGVDPTRHQLTRPRAWGTDMSHVEKARAVGASVVRVIARNGDVWTTPFSRFCELGIAVNRRHGPQWALPLQYWARLPAGGEERRQPGLPGLS